MNNNVLFGLLGVFGVSCGAYAAIKVNKTCKKLDLVVAELEKKSHVEISEDVVAKVLETKAEKKVEKVCDETIDSARREIRSAVRKKVDDISNDLDDKVAKEVADVDLTYIKGDIERRAEKYVEKNMDRLMDEAKREATKRFEGKLASICSDYNRNLSNLGSIYSSIANSFAPQSQTKEMKFTIG